jgi:hypothetical protein
MNTTLQVTAKSVYGQDKIYPVNTPAELLARIAGTKTLTLQTLRNAMELGFALDIVARTGHVLTKYLPAEVDTAIGDLLALYNLA